MDGRSPAEVFEQEWKGHAKRTANAELLDTLLMRTTQPLKVHKNGVTWKGLSYGQYCPELIPLLGKEVYLRIDECDIGRVQIWSIDDRFICLAPANQRVPANATHQELREAIAQKRRHSKLHREFYATRMRITEDLTDRITRARADANAAAAAEQPAAAPEMPGLKPIRSNLENELPKVRRAIEAIKKTASPDRQPKRFFYVSDQPEPDWDEPANRSAIQDLIHHYNPQRKAAEG